MDRVYTSSGVHIGHVIDSILGWMRRQAGVRMHLAPASKLCMFGTCDFAIAGDIVMDVADSVSSVPVSMLYDLRVPGWVDEQSIAVVMTESAEDSREILDSLSARGCMTVVLAPEGTDLDRFPGVRPVLIPDECEGMGRIGFCIGTLAAIVSEAGIMDLSEMMDASSEEVLSYFADGDSVGSLPEDLAGKVPAVYSTSDIHACAKWWKQVLGKASRDLSFFGELPEFDHNELVGWSDPNTHAPELRMVVLRSGSESKIVLDIVSSMADVLNENGRKVTVVDLGSGTTLAIDLKGVILGSIVACGWKEAA